MRGAILFDFLREHHAAFAEFFAREFFFAACGALDKIGEPDAEFDHAAIFVVLSSSPTMPDS